MANKRANGEGSIRKKNINGKIYWEGRYSDAYGKQKSVSGKTQTEVRDKLKTASQKVEAEKQELEAKENGQEYYDKNMTLNSWYNIYKQKFTNNLKPQTLASHEMRYNKYFRDTIGYKKLKHISEEDILHLQQDMKDNGLKHNTIVVTFEIIGKLFNKAIDKKIVTYNPLKELKLRIEESLTCRRALTIEELNWFYTILEEKRPYLVPLFIFLQHTGCRIGEAISLEWQDISKDMEFCVVNKTRLLYYNSEQGHTLVSEGSPKGNKKQRKVPLNNVAKQMLQDLKKQREKEALFTPNTKVFLSKCKKTLYNSYIDTQLKQITEIIRRQYDPSYPEVTPHWFRHTFASYAVAKNVPNIYIQKVGGWASSSMLNKVYAHMNEQQSLEAVKCIYE